MKHFLGLLIISSLLFSCGSDKGGGPAPQKPVILIEEITPAGFPEVGQTSQSIEDGEFVKYYFEQGQNYECHYQQSVTDKMLVGFEAQERLSIYKTVTYKYLKNYSHPKCEEQVLQEEDIYTEKYSELEDELTDLDGIKESFLQDCLSSCVLKIYNQGEKAFMEASGNFKADAPINTVHIELKQEINRISPWLETTKSSQTTITIEFDGTAHSESTIERTELGFKDDISDYPYADTQDVTGTTLLELLGKVYISSNELKYEFQVSDGKYYLKEYGSFETWDGNGDFVSCYVEKKTRFIEIQGNSLRAQKEAKGDNFFALERDTQYSRVVEELTPTENLSICKEYHNEEVDMEYTRKYYFEVTDSDNLVLEINEFGNGTLATKE